MDGAPGPELKNKKIAASRRVRTCTTLINNNNN